jgi:hypothetical protein
MRSRTFLRPRSAMPRDVLIALLDSFCVTRQHEINTTEFGLRAKSTDYFYGE